MINIVSPLLREIVEEAAEEARREGERDATEKAVIIVLMARFGIEPEDVRAELRGLDIDQLIESLLQAATCPDLASFREQIPRRRRRKRRT